MSGTGKAPIFGPEAWATRRGAVWSYWDLWFCVVAIADHDGDLDALAEAIENQRTNVRRRHGRVKALPSR